jgi:Transposase IS66 family
MSVTIGRLEDMRPLADQVDACATVLQPLHALIERHVLAAERLHGDDTTVPILAKAGSSGQAASLAAFGFQFQGRS